MLPVRIQIELEASVADSEIQDLIKNQQILYERYVHARRFRKRPPPALEDILNARVPGRKLETTLISKYINSLQKGDKSPLCLHGSTGCGKTSIVTELMHYLKQYKAQFHVLYINCLNFTSVRGIYASILQHFFGLKDKKPEQALSNIFLEPSKMNIDINEDEVNLLILDEIDQCLSNKSFIYNILEWTQSSAFPFGSILISNMADFSANVENKSKSRIKFNAVIFAPYSYQQLIEIVQLKYPDCYRKFERDAIVYLCKKIAAINSDVRIIQKHYSDALRKFYPNGPAKISIENIQSLFVFHNQGVSQILKPYEFLLEIIWRSPKKKNIQLDIEHYCLGKGIKKLRENQVLYILHDLESLGVLRLNKPRRESDFYYKYWGINLEQFAFTLETTRSKH